MYSCGDRGTGLGEAPFCYILGNNVQQQVGIGKKGRKESCNGRIPIALYTTTDDKIVLYGPALSPLFHPQVCCRNITLGKSFVPKPFDSP